MSSYPTVSAAEKYAEESRPLCKCGCGKPMFWNASPIYRAGGHWIPPYHKTEKVKAERAQRRAALNVLLDAEAERRGSRCAECGAKYIRGGKPRFHWHHRDPATKAFNVTDGANSPPERVLTELAKCDLICNACHPKKERQMQANCRNGHPLSGENLYLDPRGHRQCRICRRAADDRRHAKRRRSS